MGGETGIRRSGRIAFGLVALLPLTSAALLAATHQWAGRGGVFEHPREMVYVAIGVSVVALAMTGLVMFRGARPWCVAVSALSLLPQLAVMVVAATLLLFPRQMFMFQAIYRGDVPAVRRALAWGVSPDAVSRWGWNHENAGETALSAAADAGEVEVVRLLLDRGADPNRPDGFGEPPLHRATRRGQDATIELLLARGTDPKLRDRDGDTVLHEAALTGRAEWIDRFVDLGVDVNARRRFGETALHFAARSARPEVAQRLLRRGADPTLRDQNRQTPADVARIALKQTEARLNASAPPAPADVSAVQSQRRLVELLEKPR